MMNAETIIKTLKLQKHPEGGYYSETYRSKEIIKKTYLPERFTGDRSFCTAIYFLLTEKDISAFHKIKQDELWHFYYGDPLTIHMINQEGVYSKIILGPNITEGETLQAVVSAGTYFGAEINNQTQHFSLVGCTVAPGFDFADFKMPERKELLKLFPKHGKIIKKLTNK
jgi:hypothetical protein